MFSFLFCVGDGKISRCGFESLYSLAVFLHEYKRIQANASAERKGTSFMVQPINVTTMYGYGLLFGC